MGGFPMLVHLAELGVYSVFLGAEKPVAGEGLFQGPRSGVTFPKKASAKTPPSYGKRRLLR